MIVTSIEIQHVIVSDNNEIIEVGGIHPNNVPWKLSAERVVRAIEEQVWDFHIIHNGKPREVILLNKKGGTKILGVLLYKDPDTIILLSELKALQTNIHKT